MAPPILDLDSVIAIARELIVPGERRMLGITGAPGAGKSTLAEQVRDALGAEAVVVAMDGFHLRDNELRRLGRYQRKGAIDTFDAAGFVHLLHRLRDREPLVYVPVFDRSLEESIGSAVPVPGDVPLIVVEGNYLLADKDPWAEIASLMDESWYVEPGEGERVRRLTARHMDFGRSADEAARRVGGPDGRNAELISATRHRATRIIDLSGPNPATSGTTQPDETSQPSAVHHTEPNRRNT